MTVLAILKGFLLPIKENVTSLSVCHFSYFSIVPLYSKMRVGEEMEKIPIVIYHSIIFVLYWAAPWTLIFVVFWFFLPQTWVFMAFHLETLAWCLDIKFSISIQLTYFIATSLTLIFFTILSPFFTSQTIMNLLNAETHGSFIDQLCFIELLA